MENYTDEELFKELNQAIETLEKEAASKKVASKKVVNIHCKREGRLLFTCPVTVEEEDQLSSSTISLWTYLSRGICLLFFYFFVY